MHTFLVQIITIIAEISTFENIFNLGLICKLNLPYFILLVINIISHHPTLFMSHKAEYIFCLFSIRSQIEGFLYCLSLSICNQKIRKTNRKSVCVSCNCQIREKSLCVCEVGLSLARQFLCMKTHACPFSLHTLLRGKCGFLADTVGKLACMALCISN